MTTSAADDGGCLAPTVTEGEATAEAGAGAAVEECADGKEMKVGVPAAVEEPDEEAREEDSEEEVVEEEEEEEEVDEDEEDAGEVETADGIDAELEPLPVLKPGEEDEHEELKGEKEEMDEEPEKIEPWEGEPEEVEERKEDDGVAELHGSVANETKEMSKLEYGKSVNTNKDKDADQLSSGSDSGGSISGDMQSSELAGGLEIFVDNLPHDCVEEDIAMAFSQSGEVKSVRIIKNSSTEKKDVAFVCYASIEAAKKVLNEFKEGIEVKGKMVRVSACQDNNTLYVGNICKGWTSDQVLNTLKSIGIQECKISFPTYKGGSRGFAFLEFASHYYARAAFRRLMKSDAIFGTDRSAKVSFYETPAKSSKNRMEAKKVYLEHVPLSWDENKIKEYCEEYGEILKVDLFLISKDMENRTISFIEFSSSKGALACVAGINKAKIVDGSFKCCAYIAWPKSALKVNSAAPSNAATTTEKDKNHKEKVVVDKNLPHFQKGNKSKLTSRTKEAIMKKNSSSKLPNDNNTKLTSQDAAEVPQTSKSSEGKRKVGKNKHASVCQKPRKKARNNRNVDESQQTYRGAAVLQTSNTSKGKRKASDNRSIYINEKTMKKARDNSNLGGSSRSKSYASDLEPHAGFISPAIRDHGSGAYSRQRTQYDIHPIDVHPYARESPSVYSGYISHAGYEPVYTYEYARNRAPTPPSGSYIPRKGHY